MATYYKTESDVFTMAERLYDKRHDIVIWQAGSVYAYNKNGMPAGVTACAADPDAVTVNVDMTDDELKNARKTAATREGLRKVETEAAAILNKGDAITADDRRALLRILNVAYHNSGKIEGLYSVDGCASCEFCRNMINKAANNPLMICGLCYADRDKYKEASWRRHSLNARILSTVLFTVEELRALTIDALVRFNEDGDTVNQIHAQNLLRIAKAFPRASFGYFFKHADAVAAGLKAEGYTTRDALPENIRFIQSSILIGIPARPVWFADAVFTVYATADAVAAAVAGGAHECNGKKCMDCGYMCYLMKRRAEALQIAEYLRCGAPARKIVIAALESWAAMRAAV